MTRESRILQAVLRRVALRLGAGAAVRWLARGLAAAAGIVLGWALATMVVPVQLPLREVAVAGVVLALVSGPVLCWWLRPSLLGAARCADHRLGLADRLSTALETLAAPASPRGLGRLQVADAVEVAQGIAPRSAAPIGVPREAWAALALVGGVALWAQFLQGWTLPGLPAARQVAVIHKEGRTLVMVGQQLEAMGRARGFPETRRVAPGLRDLGRRLEGPRVTRPAALGMLQETVRELRAAQSQVERRLGGTAARGAPGAQEAHTPLTPATDPSRLQQAIRELEFLTGQLRSDGGSAREDLTRRLQAVSESLDRMNVPGAPGREVAAARREIERGHLATAESALGQVLADLTALERMLGDDQALGEARRQVETASERIAQGGSSGAGVKQLDRGSPEPSAPTASGSGPVVPASQEAAAPPPGPNQGSLPGEGRGPALGAPTPRPKASRVEEHLTGQQGEGTAVTRDLLAPGRAGAVRLPASAVPAEVAHENDRALAREPLPPAYLTLIRRYFEALAQGR